MNTVKLLNKSKKGKRDWLWDKKISYNQVVSILHNPVHPQFISLSSLLLSRKNNPREVFQDYLEQQDFCRYWAEIKRKMRKDVWNNPRIEFWQAIYERLLEKYRAKGINIFSKVKTRAVNDFCLKIGQRIKALRKQKKLTQEMLSERLNVSQQMISRIESGKENISLLTLKKMIDELGAMLYIKEHASSKQIRIS